MPGIIGADAMRLGLRGGAHRPGRLNPPGLSHCRKQRPQVALGDDRRVAVQSHNGATCPVFRRDAGLGLVRDCGIAFSKRLRTG
jgi:hypothetical protein